MTQREGFTRVMFSRYAVLVSFIVAAACAGGGFGLWGGFGMGLRVLSPRAAFYGAALSGVVAG